jgi:ubiquitin-like protein Pup
MSTRDTGGQDRTTRRADEPDETPDDGTGPDAAAARKAAIDEDVDAMLDEIDDVLETNAEEFVRGFVQKGGE